MISQSTPFEVPPSSSAVSARMMSRSGTKPSFLKRISVVSHDGVAVLHVLRAAAVVVAVFLHELKRIGGPVFAPRLDHVEMSDQQHRFVLAAAVQPDDQVLLAIVRPQDLHVAVGKSGVAKALRHGLGSGGHVAHRIRGIDFDQLLENIVGKLPGGVVNLCG